MIRGGGRWAVLTLSVLLAGCFGRIHDASEGSLLDSKTYGLEEGHPALVVFSAAWCKPCMAEIPSLNKAVSEVSGQVQIKGYVVEGAQKGVPAAPKDDELVVAPNGERPVYRLDLDSRWILFDGAKPAAGHSLPMMVFVNRSHHIVRVVQHSMNYETELLPMLRDLAADRAPGDGNPKPGDGKDPGQGKDPGRGDAGKNETMTVDAWAALAGNADGSAMYKNVTDAWNHGLGDFAFSPDDMPFKDGRMTAFVYDDGRSKPVSAVWIAADTGCKLTVHFNPDGSYKSSEGICR